MIAPLIAAFAIVPTAQAHHYRHHNRHQKATHALIYHQATPDTADTDQRYVGLSHTVSYTPERRHIARSGGEGVVGGRPAGCPHAYCGCSASLRVFGKIIPELNLAANWGRKFPPASPAPGMAAYRNHHVFIIESVNGDGTVVAHDGNSGHGLTRIHTVSLRGYKVVDPHGSRYASR